MVYIVTYQQKTFQLQILCLKFVKFYILKILSLKLSWESSKNSDKNVLISP